MEVEEEEVALAMVSKSWAVLACISMAVLYVALLYSPTLILRLPHPTSYKQFIIRRFICATVASAVSLGLSSLILLPIQRWRSFLLLQIFGVRIDHIWPAVVFPLALTSLMYVGSLLLKFFDLLDSWLEHWGEGISFADVVDLLQLLMDSILSSAYNINAWRNYVVAPITEELVFRACMIPLLLCGRFRPCEVILLSPIFFSLAHLNHFLEFYNQPNYSLFKASMAVGLQLGYTVVFGSYASFLFIRTGHLVAPLVTHIFCNFMGLPVIYSKRKAFDQPLIHLCTVGCASLGNMP
ncbi:hypothetical protein Dimus_007009 [Dionaea muscipula]